MVELTQAELLKKKREARKAKILSNSKDRLDQITSSYTAPAPELEKSDFANENDIASLLNKNGNGKGDIQAEEFKEKEGGFNQEIENEEQKNEQDNEIPLQPTPLFVAEAELPSYDPFSSIENLSNGDENPSSNGPGLQFSDTLAWTHASLLSIIIIWCTGPWILFHNHEMFSLGDISQDLWHKRICRQLNHMAFNPIHDDLGASSVINIFGYTTPG